MHRRKRITLGFVLLGCVLATHGIAAQPDTRSFEQGDGGYALAGNGLGQDARAGESVAISGLVAIVGAPNNNAGIGEAYICDGDTTPDPWGNTSNLAELVSITSNAAFGTDVALHDATDLGGGHDMLAVVSAPGMNSGMVFVFGRNNMGTWQELVSLENPTPSSLPNTFGIGVAINDACIVVGDPTANNGNGAIHVYLIDPSGAIDTNPITIEGPILGNGGEFGTDVDVLRDMIVVGAPGPFGGQDAEGGRVYLYQMTSTLRGTSIALVDTIHGGVHERSRFGACVAFGTHEKTTTLAVGMPGMDLLADQNGTVELYRDNGDGNFEHEASVTAEILSYNDHFGSSVDVDGDLLVVGAPMASTTAMSNGVGYIYRYSPTNESWSPEWMINPTSAGGYDEFGASVAIESGKAVFGVPNMEHYLSGEAGIAFLYEEPIDDQWQDDPRLPQPVVFDRGFFSTPAPMPGFGSAIAIFETDDAGDVALIGEPTNRQVHVFRREGGPGSPWVDTMLQVHPPDTQNPPLDFGRVIKMVGDLAIIAAPYEGDGGEVYVYKDVSGVGLAWHLIQTILPTSGSSGHFGAAISVFDGDQWGGTVWLAIGDTGNTFDTNNSGRVHLYSWDPWDEQMGVFDTLTDPNHVPGNGSEFGASIAISEFPGEDTAFVAVGDTAYSGHVDLFQVGPWALHHQQTLNPPNSYTEIFGNTVAIDNELVVVGSRDTANRGQASVFSRSNPLGNRATGWIPFAFTHSLHSTASPTGGIADRFGEQIEISASPRRILVSAPMLDYIDFNAGGVYIFSPSATTPNAWNVEALLGTMTSNAGDAAGPFAVGHQTNTILVGCPGSDAILGLPRRVLDFEFRNSVSWMWHGGGNMSENSLWSGDTNGADGLFSLLLADSYAMNFDIQQWAGSLEIAFNDIMFELLGYTNREITGDLLVGSPALEDMAVVDIRDGDLLIGNDVVLGPAPGTMDLYDSIGSLHFHASSITVGNRMEISQGSSLLMELMPPSSRNDDDPPTKPSPTITADQVIAGGTLFVEIRPEGDIFLEGDQFELIASTSAPIQGGFDIIVLPGLPDGLAFELTDVPGLRGPSGSTLTATVVSLAGLLDFGDPNSVAVEGDATGVEVVDLTGDFAEEICVTFAGAPGQLVIFENDGAGGVAQQIVIPTGDEPVDITSGDFDGDGTNDLAVANRLSQDVTLYYNVNNNPSDGLDTLDLNVDGPPTCLAGINANYDSYGDLVVGLNDTDGDGNGYWVVYLGSSALRMPGGMGEGGGIAPSGIPLGADPANEEDQKAYLFAGNQSNGKTGVAKNATVLLGTVTLELDEYTTGADPGGISTGDLDGDGQADLAVTSTTNGTVAILRQETVIPGDFLPAIFCPVGEAPTRITAVDFDGDGNLDLATIVQEDNGSGGNAPLVRILQGDGNLSFTSMDIADGEGVVLIDAGDVSGNGDNELVTIGDGALMRGSSSPLLSLRKINNATCPGDFDGTGSVGIDDLLTLLGEFGSCTENCQGDMDGDSDVDIDDMLGLIGVWGPCPR